MLVGSLKASLLSFLPAVPWRLPSTISTRPEGVYLITTCPFTSTPQTLPSASTRTPWDETTVPSPQACSIFPLLSNWMTGCLPRLNTQTLSWRSTATPEHSPKFHPAGSWAQSLTTLYGSAGPDFRSAENAGSEAANRKKVSADFMRE